jgi:hypothetical protein
MPREPGHFRFLTHSGHDASYSITSASMIKLRGMVRPDFMLQVVTGLIRPDVRVEVEIIAAAK